MSVASWFQEFCSNICVRDGGTISTRYKRITKRLNLEYWNTDSSTANSWYVGSYGRGTAAEGFSDLDMIFKMPYLEYVKYSGHSGNGQSALLQAVKKSIEKTYSNTSIRGDGQVVLVPFNDDITFEVVPAFQNKDGSFTYPDANDGGSWKVTNPKPEIAAIQNRNSVCNGNLVQLCRMMRSWKKRWDVPIGGLLIDSLAYQFIEKWAYRDKSYLYYDYMSRDFFEWISNQASSQTHWKAPGSGQYVYAKGLFQYKAKRCYNISLEAIALELTQGQKKWREIYGNAFPG